MMRIKKQMRDTGFTLVEIMIVVGIIVLLAALALPGLLRSRLNANEAAAITGLKTICWAAITYRTTNPAYPANLSELAGANPSYVDSVLATGTKQGYTFNLTGDANFFNITARPVTQNITGVRTFFADAAGVIRASSNGVADNSSPAI